MMRHMVLGAVALTLAALLGCGRARLAGAYRPEIRLMEGRQESTEEHYSLAEVRARAAEAQRTLTLKSDGRYVWRSTDVVSEGNWRVEEDTLILRDDTQNGHVILPALRSDRRWRIGRNGEIINDKTYAHYGYEELYVRE